MTGAVNDPRKCVSLTFQQVDALFFPGRGGKVNKARAFCGTCPVRDICLKKAISLNLEGFFAGTTKEERDGMRDFLGDLVVEVIIIDDYIPEPVNPTVTSTGRRVKRRPPELPYQYLDDIEPTEKELEEVRLLNIVVSG